MLIRDFLVFQQQVVLYGSRAMDRHHSGSDVDLCLVAPSLRLEDLLLLPWSFDLQLTHRVDHSGLLEHIERVGVALLKSAASN